MKDKINLFVPGRLCLFGEHSDWASKYKKQNNKINNGLAIVTGIDQGIYASITKNKFFIIRKDNLSKKVPMDKKELKKIATSSDYFSYVCGVALEVLKKYDVGGIEINITKTTIPEKKGLSSSAAICVLVARAFNETYKLNLSIEEEIDLAYLGERHCSKCGKLDQVCAYGKKTMLMEFDDNEIITSPLEVGANLHLVFANLNCPRNTKKILSSLNECYPEPKTKVEKNVFKYLNTENKKIIDAAIIAIKNGDAKEVGNIMNLAQEKFDLMVAKKCDELEAPKLHEVLNDSKIKKYTYGGKLVGAGGDGTVQFIAKDKKSALKLQKYLEEELGLENYSLTLEKTKKVKKAIIPLAGSGTRMYPFTKSVPKAFLPIIDKGILKPSLMLILEEINTSSIEEIGLIIDKKDKPIYEDFFNKKIDKNTLKTKELKKYEEVIEEASKKIKYIYQDKEKDKKYGLGYAVYLCKKFADNNPVLLVLGDQILKSNTNISCTEQVLNFYEKNPNLIISAYKVPLDKVSSYGILTGKLKTTDDNFFDIEKMTEKPTKAKAKSNELFVRRSNKKEYYAVFGEYVLTNKVFKYLEENINNKKLENNEYGLTGVLDKIIHEEKSIAYIVDGNMYDVGNISSYENTMKEFSKN